MIEQQGSVVRVDGADALIRVGPVTGCPACEAGKGCGAGVFGRLLQRRPVVLSIENRIGARPGDVVRVGIAERLYLSLVARLYLLPVLAGLAGAAFGHYLGMMASAEGRVVDLAALTGAVIGVLACLPRGVRDSERFMRGAVHLVDRVPGPATGACAGGAIGQSTVEQGRGVSRDEGIRHEKR